MLLALAVDAARGAPFLTADGAEELRKTGLIRTGISLPKELVPKMRSHFWELPWTASNWWCWTVTPEQGGPPPRVGINDGRPTPQQGTVRFERSIYGRSIYGDRTFLEPVLTHALEQGLARHFACRYVIISHDIFLGMGTEQKGFGMHFDGSSVPQPLEASEDLTLYVSLTRTNEQNGGRIGVMPASSYSVARHARRPLVALRKTAESVGHLELDRIWPDYYTPLFQRYREALGQNNAARNASYGEAWRKKDSFNYPSLSPGEIILFKNQQFHNPEPNRKVGEARDVYVIRMEPVYDLEVTCKSDLFGTPANRWLLDIQERRVIALPGPVNISAIPKEFRRAI
jgi:hypothetical protein